MSSLHQDFLRSLKAEGVNPRLVAVREQPLQERLWSRCEPDDDGCLVWQGAKNDKGYGRIGGDGRSFYTHRVAYEIVHGPIPDGLHIDHLCRNPACCNPEHLEAVSPGENVRRGRAGAMMKAKHAAVTQCPRGHPYDEENTIISRGGRSCRACRRIASREWNRRNNGYYERNPPRTLALVLSEIAEAGPIVWDHGDRWAEMSIEQREEALNRLDGLQAQAREMIEATTGCSWPDILRACL